MPLFTAADTIRILVSTDNHVGYGERDPKRGDDSWKTFDEIMTLAKERDVDMVLLAGDLFHDNKPSRKSLYQVMRSLRANCFGDKPCELAMLSDESEHFAGAFNHANYNDADINVAIPVFSIHGNHDDPSGEGHLAALDILAMSGLLNYYGRTPEADKIDIKPVLLQKGRTKLALYGMSNVRDERLFRTFRDNQVRFFQPSTQTGDWFNIMSVHQNHHAYTETSYLPEQYLPDFMNLIVWGHEHECKIKPQYNPERDFNVMQPGSSVATSLSKGEAVPKHVAIVSVKGTDYDVEPIRLKTVRPFVMKEIVLNDFDDARKSAMVRDEQDSKARLTYFLVQQMEQLIEEANTSWREQQEEAGEEVNEDEMPQPLIRLRIEHTPPDGGTYHITNPQRFASEFADRVANTDLVQYHRKRKAARASKLQPDMPEAEAISFASIDSVKVDKLVKEFLEAQSLTILPQNRFNDAVGQFVDKDDKHAMEEFLHDTMGQQQESLLNPDPDKKMVDLDIDDESDAGLDDVDVYGQMEEFRQRQEEAHARGELKRRRRKGTIKPKPTYWDSDEDGPWEDSVLAIPVDEEGEKIGDEDDDDASVVSGASKAPARGNGSRAGRAGRAGKAAAGTARKAPASKKTAGRPAGKPAVKSATGRGKNKKLDSDEDDDEDVIMLDDDGEDESQGLFVSQAKSTAHTQRSASPPKRAAPKSLRGRAGAAGSSTQQSRLNFGASQVAGSVRSNGTGRAAASKPGASKRLQDFVEDEISDDDDAFEPPPAAQRRTGRQ
ncbi:hypothetical protein DOTSEDRAFT_90803 [Dothistroma septosporum NZE10]|uniref:Double-strand break repair protein n=1 Tax=Dothistroma septosporum (strain NZE10 / CBS 128990) TaxID=675120 RepID=N1PE61_DOTSN|nr:hypothetical protein DOTSEDRAFT_90803 [Dothistroma septosporum NZE10]